MRSLRPLPLVLALGALLAATPLAAGCGEPSPRARTADAVRELGDTLTQQREELEFELLHARLRTKAELADGFGRLSVSAGEQVRALDAIDPPPSLVAAVRTLRRAIARQRDALWRVSVAGGQLGPRVPAVEAAALRRGSERILDARRRLDALLQAGGT